MEQFVVGGLERMYPWPEGRWVRAMMLQSLDGAVAGPDGRSGSISSPADRAVLAETRRLADAVLVGAETIRVERYRPMVAKPEHAQARASLGLAAAPALVVVSGSLDLPWDEPMWSNSTIRPIVITVSSADTAKRRVAEDHADLVVLDQVEPDALLDALEARGLQRIVCEGGPQLLDQIVRAGLVDELDLTIAPWLVGREPQPFAPPALPTVDFTLTAMMEHEGFVFSRYLASSAPTKRP